jgi:hypothetical protein
MTKNNFDMSSTGLNIAFNGYLDTDLARRYFDESIIESANVFNRASLYFYDCEPSVIQVHRKDIYAALNFFTKPNTDDINGRDFIELWRYEFGDAKELDFEAACRFVYEHAYCQFNWREYSDIIAHLLPADYDYFITRSYSQGDAEFVVHPKGYNTKNIDNLFWDAPIFAVLTVDGDELYFDEHVKNLYRWDKDEILVIIKTHFGQVVYDWCTNNLPEYLEC